MSSPIGFISTYPEMTSLAKEVAEVNGFDAIVGEGAFEHAITVSKEMEQQGVKVLISRGMCVDVLRKTTTLPVISCNSTAFDVLLALHKAKDISRKIAFIQHTWVPFDIQRITDVLEVSIEIFMSCRSIPEVEQRLLTIKEAGHKVVIGGAISANLASRFGLHGFLIKIGRESIIDAFIRASEVVRSMRLEKEKTQWLISIVDSACDGIIATDAQGKITVYNRSAEKLTGIRFQHAVGRYIEDVLPELRAGEALHTNKHQAGAVRQVRGYQLLTTHVPVTVNQNLLGVVTTLQEVRHLNRIHENVRRSLKGNGLVAKYTFSNLIGQSIPLLECKAVAKEYAKSDSDILIAGETGTGKEILAHSIHHASNCRNGPFVAVNCAALPQNLLESELFGYEEGAFTGAKRGGKVGLFEMAAGGTIFLDEISCTSLELQARLLRVIEEKEIMRIGGNQVIPVDFRVIAATNRDLGGLILEGLFREDLYFRLTVLILKVPPLRERIEDIPLLVEHFLCRSGRETSTTPTVGRDLMEALKSHTWPGNVRELENVILSYRALHTFNECKSEGVIKRIINDHQSLRHAKQNPHSAPGGEKEMGDTLFVREASLLEMESQLINEIIKKVGWNKSEAARRLKISRTTLMKKLSGVNGDFPGL